MTAGDVWYTATYMPPRHCTPRSKSDALRLLLTFRYLGYDAELWHVYANTADSRKAVADVKVGEQAGPFALSEGQACGSLTRMLVNPMSPETVGMQRLG